MNLPPFHTSAGDGHDAPQTPFGDGPLTLGPEWGDLEGVVLFDPETDTSPYARAGKGKKAARVPGEKPSVKASAKAKAARLTTQASAYEPNTAYHQADQPPASDEPVTPVDERPSARRGGLRIVPTDDAAEIRRLAEAQRQSEAARAFEIQDAPVYEPQAASPYASQGAAAEDAGEPGPTARQAFLHALRGGAGGVRGRGGAQEARGVSDAAHDNPHGTPGNTGAFSSVPAFSTFEVADDGKPAARGEIFAGAAARKAQAQAQAAGEEPAARPERRKRDPEAFWRAGLVWVTLCTTLLVSLVMLYFPAQELYLAIRENERLTHELELNLERNRTMQERVASLQTPEGIQDEAHRVYDLVMPGEHAVQVLGVPYEEPSGVAPVEIPRGSGQNTHTWATNLLDRVFGVTGPNATTAQEQDVATITESGADIVAQGD